MSGVRVVVVGAAEGPVVVLDEPLSFWGGFSAERGVVTDEHHPQAGVSLSGAIVVMVGARGSSSASSVLAESVRLGTAPAAILMQRPDEILVTGALVARELYQRTVPIVLLDDPTYAQATGARSAALSNEGALTFS
jgi:predicted aconitase with swiveling domain